jgi:O-antigen/teichoic acid export membrane protein
MGMLKNSTIVVAGIILSNILAYIFHIYVGRSLGPVEYGVFGALMALFMIIALPAGAISYAITKFTAKLNSKKEYGKIGLLRKKVANRVWIYSVIFFLAIALLSPFIADYLKIGSIVPIIFVGFTLIFAMILPVNRGILQGMKKFKIYSWNTIIESITRLGLVILLLFLGLKVNGAILAYGLGYLIAFLLIFPFIKETKFGKNESLDMKQIYRFILLVLIVNLILQGIINVPTIFIKHFMTSEFTGYWTAALTLARATLFIATGITIVMFPEVAEKKDQKDKKIVFKKALILTLLASVGIALIFWVIPQVFISLLYGSEFLGAVPILKWMGIAMIGVSGLQLSLNYWLAGRE